MRSLLLAEVMIIMAIGCNQETITPVDQRTDQVQQTPTTTAQDAATQGSQVYTYIINAPGSAAGLPNPSNVAGLSSLLESVANDPAQVGKTNAGYAQAGITVNITTGGTTPSQAGTTTGSGVATANPAQTASAYPTQDVRPEFTTAVPITFGMPGSAVSGSANAAGSGGSMGDPQANPTQTPTYTEFRVPAQYASQALQALQELWAKLAPTSQPAN